MTTQVDKEYRQDLESAVKELAADLAFRNGDAASGKVVYDQIDRIADAVQMRLSRHYSHTRKAKTQRKIED